MESYEWAHQPPKSIKESSVWTKKVDREFNEAVKESEGMTFEELKAQAEGCT